MRYKTKEGRPLCRYCLTLLPEGKRYVGQMNASSTGGPSLRSIYEPTGTYGRNGSDLFCTMRCAEEWATRRITGSSVPRGKSHDRASQRAASQRSLPPLYDTPHDRAVAKLTGEEVVPLPAKEAAVVDQGSEKLRQWMAEIEANEPDPVELAEARHVLDAAPNGAKEEA